MDTNKIIQQGELVKFIITSNRADFDLDEHDYTIELKYGMMGKSIILTQDDALDCGNGQYIISFSTEGMIGKVTARTTMMIPDQDAPGLIRPEVDEQMICFVVTSPCPKFIACPACTGTHDITFERTEQSEVAELYKRLYVTDIITPEVGDPYPDYRPVTTADGLEVFVHRLSVSA